MDITKKQKLESQGWKVGNTEEFNEEKKIIDSMKLLRWIRNSGNLQLQVLENGKWINYKQSLFYKKDAKTSSNSGFATAQE